MPNKKVKTFTSRDNAMRAIKKQGLQLIPHELLPEQEEVRGAMRWVYRPFFTPELEEDAVEIRRRGFSALRKA